MLTVDSKHRILATTQIARRFSAKGRIPIGLSVIERCTGCGVTLDVSDLGPFSEATCGDCGCTWRVLQNFSSFVLTGEIGQGGIATVFRALDPALEREVALKLLRHDLVCDSEYIQQLEDEARITASINHPNVVRVFSAGRHNGLYYIAMEIVSGGTLAQQIDTRGRLPEIEVLNMAIHTANGLRAASERGLLHRDVKPANILFSEDGLAKIADFGLAVSSTARFDESELRGTPYYIAPERVGRTGCDLRSDLYSFGATLFHALAGRPPFEAESSSEVALKHLNATATPSVQSFAPDVTTVTAHIVKKMLQKDPGQRYQSYAELIENLEFARNELLGTAAKPKSRARVVLETEADQRAWGWLAAAMTVIAVVLVFGFALRDRIFSAKEAAGANAPGSIAAQPKISDAMFPNERRQLVQGDAVGAADGFRKIAQSIPAQPAWNWATLFEGLAELAAARKENAKVAFRTLAKRPSFSERPEDARLAGFFREMAALLADDAPIEPDRVAKFETNSFEAVALLLAGMHEWESGRTENAVSFFRTFRASEPKDDAAWVTELRPLAARHIDQFTASQMIRSIADPIERTKMAAKFRGSPANKLDEAEWIALNPDPKIGNGSQLGAPVNGSTYHLVCRRSEKAMDNGGSTADGAPLKQWTVEAGNPNQEWKLVDVGSGYFNLICQQSGKALDNSGSIKDGTMMKQWTVEPGNQNQHWLFVSVGGGYYNVVCRVGDKVLDNGESKTDGTGVKQWTYQSGNLNQHWSLRSTQQGKASVWK
jgi:hypothetical protein